jgi:hypothetical protein
LIFSPGGHVLASLTSLFFARNAGHSAFKGQLADMFGVRNLDAFDRFMQVSNMEFRLGSMMKMDRPDDLQAFARKIREYFLQFDRCRSKITTCGSYYFFEKVPAENMVEILD